MRGLGLTLVATTLLSAVLSIANWATPPDLTRYEDRSRIVADRTGKPLRVFMSRDQKWRLLTRPGDVDPLYLAMLKAYEDKRFDSHWGLDPKAVLRAAGQAASAGRFVSGASTLTMQAARLLEPKSRGLRAKAVEAWRALQLEAAHDKDAVLSIYLTLAPFGGAVEGVRAASLKLFGREPTLLTPAEAALLVALPQSPNVRRPDRRPEAARLARDRVLARAAAAGVISQADIWAATQAPLPSAYRALGFWAPHLAEEAVVGRSDFVRTTLDAELQTKVERRLAAVRSDFPAPVAAAAIIVDAKTAEVRALAGSPDYFDRRRSGMIDMTLAKRSPGSALKPFVYGLAFERLLVRPETLIGDRPFREAGYAPANFGGGHAGDVTIAEALAQSLNIPAVKVLRRLGPARFDAALATVGVGLSFDRESGDPGLAMALGGVGVSLRDLARLYLSLADGRVPLDLATRAGQSVEWRRLFGPETARSIREILWNAPPPPGRASDGRIAFKTGTSYGFRDALAVGLHGGHVIAVWVGRPDGGYCAGCVGRTAAAPVLFDLARLTPSSDRAPVPPPAPSLTPRHLRHFDQPNFGPRVRGKAAPKIQFPVDKSKLRLTSSGRAPLVATGGVGPYNWLINGSPAGASAPGAASTWRPQGPGYHRIVVVDQAGAIDQVNVYISSR